jgi:membrane-associated phospholipid phosphatase
VQTGVFWGLVVLMLWWVGAPKLVWQIVLELAIVATLLVSVDLILSGEHWPSDAVGSALVISVSLITAAIVFEALPPRLPRLKQPAVQETVTAQ